MWQVWRLFLYETSENRIGEASFVMTQMANSLKINPDWAMMQLKLTAQQSKILTEMGSSIAQTISEAYESNQKIYDGIDRRRSNANLYQEDVVDPTTGDHYKVESGSNYYWINLKGEIIGTNIDARPNLNFKKLIIIP